MTIRPGVLLLPLGVCVALAAPALAHSRLDPAFTPVPRSTDTGLKTDPCGGVAATTNNATRAALAAGSQITIHWQESILHAGYFIIDLSADNDQTFTQYVLGTNLDPKNDAQTSAMTPPNSSDPTTYVTHHATVTIPNINCPQCTLRLRQFMSDSNTYYHSCADVAITGGATTPTSTGTSTTAGTKPPAPTNLKVTVKVVNP